MLHVFLGNNSLEKLNNKTDAIIMKIMKEPTVLVC